MSHISFAQSTETVFRAYGEEFFLQKVIIFKAILAAGGIQYPVSDVNKVKKSAKLLVAQFNIHWVADPFPEEILIIHYIISGLRQEFHI